MSVSWIPEHVTGPTEPFTLTSGPHAWHGARPTDWAAVGADLRRAHERLRELPVRRIVDALDLAAARWADRDFPERRAAVAAAAQVTGMSTETVDRALDSELGTLRAPSLIAALQRELGDPEVLDGFRAGTTAIGPRVVLAVFSGNVPGLPARSLARALLVKAALIAKIPAKEPNFTAAFLRTLHEVQPLLADAVVATYWGRADDATMSAALEQADAVVAYGSDQACAAVRAKVAPHQIYEEHGHKLSFGVIGDEYFRLHGPVEVARRIAADCSDLDQHACLSPQVYLVAAPHARAVAEHVAHAMRRTAADCPPGTVADHDATVLQHRRLVAEWRAASTPTGEVWAADGLEWTVVLDDELLPLSGAGNRVARIVAVPDVAAAVDVMRPYARYLQNVGLGAVGEEFRRAAEELARLGASRLAEPGTMSRAGMEWRHDGQPRIAGLLRWCDVEHGNWSTAVPAGVVP
ncbi:acyl-CoA reductase [Actinosynnema sp. NPDC047251]|uniref:Acyl-CoA reductase n=1 Tax=Saccharothrix espanaensis (strain ATCC 51144 / DSM 44229 / JCM 9112 / NBRC 15066 / NRRL 15764) TaxID=1179773 RepID=K0K3H1_SACES|nr:acyl-CoA reductase [Saccharothrix espanaensis]CCH31439.1 Acyl-CoA reductase [Saccharothrix espanaensis DSM 44229]